MEGGGLKLGLYGIVWGMYWIILDYMGLYGIVWGLYWIILEYMGLYMIIWDYMGLFGIIWDYMGLYGSSGGRGASLQPRLSSDQDHTLEHDFKTMAIIRITEICNLTVTKAKTKLQD